MAREFVTQSELEAALQALRVPGRFDAAERLVAQAAPGLQRILLEALASGGWGAEDDAREVDKALSGDPHAARASITALLGEQTRIAMLVGVAVGIELSAELGLHQDDAPPLTVSHHSTTDQGTP
ncbi:MAG: hypothetical protein JHD16_10750 [Solirubrobacteraceae bacterium]|nr:hypothetical protein [Solirubrobacteraceae bacterium]